jgi:acetyl-CoA carboxylase biotin carboxyl carrier protein
MDFVQIQKLIKDFEKSNLTELELEFDNVKIKLSKNNPHSEDAVDAKTNRHIEVANEPRLVEQVGLQVKSPLVGTFYSARSPKEQPLVKVGQAISKGDPICIIEAMKIMNEITAPISGVISQIHVKNGQAVGFDQLLVTIT